MRKFALVAAVAALTLSLAAPAFAAGSGGTGNDFGEHHSSHAVSQGGFDVEMNPGVHRGFSNWDPTEE